MKVFFSLKPFEYVIVRKDFRGGNKYWDFQIGSLLLKNQTIQM